MIRFKAAYDDFMEASNECGLLCKDPSLTQQHQAEDANINVIVGRFGMMPPPELNSVRVPMFGDFTEVKDYQSCLHAQMQAMESFMQMPASLRSRLDNDPGRFVEYCADPANLEEMRKMGLAVAALQQDVAPVAPEPAKPA